MSTTSGGDNVAHMQDSSVTTVYNGDRTVVVGQKASPPSSSVADSGLDNSNTESSASDAKLIIDVPDFSREMETPRTGIDNPCFETDKTVIPKPLTNGHNGTVNLENGKHEKDKMAEAVNLELINMKPFAKSANGTGNNGVPAKKHETSVNMNDSYDDYFIPVNEHKKYIRGGEKLYVTKDKRDMTQSKKPFMCWVFGLVLLAAAVTIAILASTGIIFNNETAVESHSYMASEKIAGFGNHHSDFSSVSPSPDTASSTPFSPPTTDMSGLYLPRTVEGEIVIDNMEFTPGMANKSSREFEELASSIETELKQALFKEQTLIGASDSVHVKVYEFASGSVVAKYRIGTESTNDDGVAQDFVDAETLKTRLDSYLRKSNGYLYNYRIPIHRLRSDRVLDKCKMDNGKCSHFCNYNYVTLDFECSCPSNLVLKANKKDCKRIDDSDMIDDVVITNNDEENDDTKLTFDSFPEHDSNSESETIAEPEPSSEPEVKAEPEPSSEPEAKAEPEPSSEPEVKAEPEPSSEPETKAEPEPSSEPETKAEPEPEVKAEPEPSSEPEVKAEPEPSSEPEVKAEPEPSSEPEVKAEPEPSSEPEVKAVPEPSSEPEVKAEPEPSSEPEAKAEPEPSSEPEAKAVPESSSKLETIAEPEPSSEPEVKAEPEPSSEPEIKAEPVPSSEPEVKAEPEPSSEPEVKAEPEPSSEPEVKAEPEPSSEPEAKAEPEPVVKTSREPTPEPETKPEPSVVPISKSSTTENYELLSDVDISSELESDESNNKPKSSSAEALNRDQSEREAKSHTEEVFGHEIKPEMTYSVSTESEFETKTESVSKESSKSKETIDSSLGDVIVTDSEESTTLAAVTENWLTTTIPSGVPSIPKLPSDLEVTEKENGAMEEETKTESTTPLSIEPSEMKSENKSVSDLMSGSNNENSSSGQATELPEKSISDDVEDVSGMVTTTRIDTSTSNTGEDMSSSSKQYEENVSKEYVTEAADMTTVLPPSVEQGAIKEVHSPADSSSSEKNNSDDLSSLEKTNIPDPTKKLQSLTSLEEQVTDSPNADVVVSTSTQSNIDGFNENGSVEEQESLDQIMPNVGEQNVADVESDDEKTSALDLYQKPESKKKEKKTSKNPDVYVSDAGFTKRNKTKTEKENKKNSSKPDLADLMPEMMGLSKCQEGQFQCVNSTTKDGSYCVQMSSRCDANRDCIDNSDEFDCAENDCAGNFQCKSGECLQRNLVCNNIMDCEDGSDEQSCDSWKCADDEKQCTSGQCLPASYFCDGKSDCSDHVDELQCDSPCNGYQCPNNGRCVSNALRCNGVNDCAGGEDEQNCECNADEFKCKTGPECIPKSQVCDNVAQCTDRSDEWQCVQLDGTQLLAKKDSETAVKVCNTNWSDQWSNFVCQSLGFTETKTTNFRPNESNETSAIYLKLKDGATVASDAKSLTGYLEQSTTPCDTVEIKCSAKHLCGDFGGKDPLSMEMWPSVVYLENTRTHKSCTSSLVKSNWLLSSYSCVHSVDASLSADQWQAVSSKSRVATESNLTRRSVSRIISHPGVKYEKLRYHNDTVLIELSEPYELSNEVNTICLPEKFVDYTQPCVTASWSYESPGVFKQFSRSLSDPLMATEVCNSTKHFNGFLTEREICVAPGEMEASHMEIGSPLMCLAENGLWQLQGTLSYRGGYGRSSKPSVYDAVLDAVPWAENTIASGV